MKVQVPFQRPPVAIRELMGSRVAPGVEQSEVRAITEVVKHPEFQRLVDETTKACENRTADGTRQRGRPGAPAKLFLTEMVTALVLGTSARAGRNKVFSNSRLRALAGLDPLTEEHGEYLSSLTSGEVSWSEHPSSGAGRYFVAERTVNRFPAFVETVQDCALRVAADAVHRHDLDCGWLATDGTRVRATTRRTTGNCPDEGAAVFSRGDGEDSFNQRHVYPVILGNAAPFVIDLLVTPPRLRAHRPHPRRSPGHRARQ